MPIGLEKSKLKRQGIRSTYNSGAREAGKEITPRIHFYVVRNAGDRLRWISRPVASKKLDRMVGR